MMIGNKFKKGDWIKCKSQDNMRNVMEELSDSGYHAVALGFGTFIIHITGEPERVKDETSRD